MDETKLSSQPPGESSSDAGSAALQARETHLLLSALDLALTRISLAARCEDRERAARYLSQAVDSYGSVKGLLRRLGLTPEQLALVNERLEIVRHGLLRATEDRALD